MADDIDAFRRMQDGIRLQRWRQSQHLNFAQAAAQKGVSLRQYAMLECGVTAEELAAGDYTSTTERRASRRSPGSCASG